MPRISLPNVALCEVGEHKYSGVRFAVHSRHHTWGLILGAFGEQKDIYCRVGMFTHPRYCVKRPRGPWEFSDFWRIRGRDCYYYVSKRFAHF